MTPFLLSLLFLLSRILHLLFCFPSYDSEDLLYGTLPKELITGLKIPFFDYAANDYHGGTLVYGVLTVPFFLLFGQTVFSLRLTAILFQYGAFITWYFFMKRFFGKTPALYASLLYLFSPPWLTLYAMFANGCHPESILFTILGLFLLYKILYTKRHTFRNALLLGLLSGFGTYFTYGVFVSTLSFLLLWLSQDRKLFQKKEFTLFALSFLIGFSPWFVYNSLYQFHGVDRIREAFAYSDPGKIFILPFRFLKLVTFKVLSMLSFNYREGGHYNPHITLLNLVYYAAALFSYIFLYRFERSNKKTHFFFLFPILYLGVASISRLNISTYFSTYLVPLFPFFFAVIALGLYRLEDISKTLQKVSWAVLVILLAMGLKGELNLLSPKEFKLSLKHRGYSYSALGGAFVGRHVEDFETISNLVQKIGPVLSPSDRFAFYRGLAVLYYRLEKPGDFQKYLPWIKGLDEKYQPFFLTEMGSYLNLSKGPLSEPTDYVTKYIDKESQPYILEGLISTFHLSGIKQDRMLEYTLGEMNKFSPENRRALAYALGKLPFRRLVEESLLDKLKRRQELERLFPPDLLPLYYRGVGSLLTRSYHPSLEGWPLSIRGALHNMDPERQKAIFWGAGFEAPLFFEDPYEYNRMSKVAPPAFRETFQQGLQDRFDWGGRNYWIEGKGNLTRRER